MDTTEYQTMEPDSEVVATDAKEEAVVDTAMTYNNSNNSQEQHQVKEGFNTNSDVKNFVIGNSYYHNGVTLKITENGMQTTTRYHRQARYSKEFRNLVVK